MTIAGSGDPLPEHIVLAYHERTKHHYSRYAASLGYLDWANQPNPFRRYEEAPLVRLPLPDAGRTLQYWQLYASDDIEPAPLSVDSISLFFRYALSLTAWKQFQGNTWPLRVNPSSGNLHPTEGYALLPALDGIHDHAGVYHYAAREHGLELRANLDPSVWAALTAGLTEGSFLVGLSSVLWREAWKYGERAFRYCQHDTGHALGTMRFAAAALGWKLRLLDRVDAYSKILQHVRNLPDVADASLSSTVPLSGQIEEGDYEDAQVPTHKLRVMSGVAGTQYFETMRIPLLQGRYFLGADTSTSQQVAVVNRAFVEKFWPGEQGVGKYLITPDAPGRAIEVVGVVQTGIYSSLGETSTPFLYRPLLQNYSPSVILQIRTRDSSDASVQTLPHGIEALLPKIVTFDSRTMDQQLLLSIAPFRAAASSLAVIAFIALGLAIVGVYGIATYATARRTKEIGVRVALGATRRGIMWMIARQGVFLIISGTLFGMPLAIGASFAVKRLLFAVAPLDVVTYSTALLAIASTGLFATLLPAVRASRINPMKALRME